MVSWWTPGVVERGAGAGEQRVGDVAVEGRDDDEHAGRALEARPGQGAVALHQRSPGAGIGRVPRIERP